MARAHRTSDDAYNARRRLKREAARLEKQAGRASGSYSERLKDVAEELRNKAANLYYNPERDYRTDLIRQSKSVRSMSEERQTDILLSSNIGSRIYAGTREKWIDEEDYNLREERILEAFGVSSMLDVLKILEKQLGDILYSDDTTENYDAVTLAIMKLLA